MRLNTKQYAELLYDVAHDKKGVALEKTLKEFLNVVQARRDTALMSGIVAELGKVMQKKHDDAALHITAARTVPRKIIDALREKLEVHEDAATIEHEDKKLAGGVLARYGDTVLDATVHSLLNTWKHALNAEY
ncbi:MAG TPA: hypothetical protein DDW36_04445 [Candidatus Magasanikbacteria bacterium]|nr:hypothetical protein [Candidatus Magasanikbacteria bacterium]